MKHVSACLPTLLLLMLVPGAPAWAQRAELPTMDDFVVGERWQWRRLDARTKLQTLTPSREVVDGPDGLSFKYHNGDVQPWQYSFVGPSDSKRPWRVWPLTMGAKWSYESDWTRSDGVTGNTKQEAEVVAYEPMTVPAGTFEAFRIEYKGWYRNSRGGSGRQNDTYWYVPALRADVKRVRDEGTYNGYIQELVSHTRP